jgi:hypothetical protein
MNLAICVDNTEFGIAVHTSCAYVVARSYQGCRPEALIFVHLHKKATDPFGRNLFAEYFMGTA